MNWLSSILPIGLATLATAAIAGSVMQVSESPPRTSPSPTATPEAQAEQLQRRRHKITVKVAEIADLQVKEGQRVERTNIIADRGRERRRFNQQKQQLELTLTKLQSTTITPPTPPRAVPALRSLPPVSYLEQQAAIDQAKTAIAKVESEITTQKQVIAYLSELEHLNPLVLEHEQAQLGKLQQAHTAAVQAYKLAVGKLQSAKDRRGHQEYGASVDQSNRVEAVNQAQLAYQRQLADYEQRLRDKEFQLAQIDEKLRVIDDAIANLAVVRSPYDGRVRKIRDLGQGPDGLISFEIVLLVADAPGASSSPAVSQ